jgi:PhnB protein
LFERASVLGYPPTESESIMKLNPYLAFDGRCREAFEFYEKALGGRVAFIQTYGETPMASQMPTEAHPRVMHVTLEIGDQVLQGADTPPGQFSQPAGFAVAIHCDLVDDGERMFSALAQDGTVQMPFQATFWAKGFGMLIDRFGTPWIINAGQVVGS